MPIEVQILQEESLLHVVFRGTLTDADLRDFAEKLAGAEVLAGVDRELVDLRDVAGPEISSDALRDMSERFTAADRAPAAVRSAVVAGTDFAFGMARMYQTFRSESELQLRVFREMGEALAFLGLEREPE